MKTSVFFRLLDFSQKRNHISLESLEETFWWRHANAEKKVFSDFFSPFNLHLSSLSTQLDADVLLRVNVLLRAAICSKMFWEKVFQNFPKSLSLDLVSSVLFQNGPFPASFQFSWREINVLYKNWPKIVVKLRTSGVANDLSVYWATTSFLFCISQERYY